jgi:DNA-directed RNA polymerase subunit RPC12/RpoP
MAMAAPPANFRPALPTPPASTRDTDDFPFADEPTVSMPLLEAAEAEEPREEPEIVFDDSAPKPKTRQVVVVCARCGEDFIAEVPEQEKTVVCVNCGHINNAS